MNHFVICVLLYGDFPALAQRCLDSLKDVLATGRCDLRIGLNAVSEATQQVVHEIVAEACLPRRVLVQCVTSPENIHKYPMMRKMFHTYGLRTGQNVIWFDDDSSRIAEGASADDWLNALDTQLETADMLGSVYSIRLGGKQAAWIRKQPWYRGKIVADKQQVKFATGGWWCIKAEILKRFNWPVPELNHNGGDVMLGELFRQNDLKLRHYRFNVRINADDAGRESQAPRRGFTSRPIGWD
jgi:hypothetical protein